MNNSDQENLDQRTSSSMEDSTATTIEFLRARLLSERSVSRSARQRAEELAKRVAELEEQLRIVSLQRMKAEKATANVLAILESNEISDDSETYDSNSDQDTPSESKVGSKASKAEEGLVSSKVRKYELEHSGSGHDFPPAQGRSLSWKGRKHSQRSLEKYKDPSLRRSGFASTSSSPKHRQGKSCRQMRSKESRSTIEEFRASPIKVDSPENGVANTSEDFPNCLEPVIGRIEDGEEKALTENPISGHLENGQHAHSNELEDDAYSSDRDMEKALEHQAQLIDHNEAMEKAQREWEEKFRENNGSTPDSYDPGNRSDVTKEGYEIKVQAPHHAGTIAAQFNGAKSEVENASNIKPNDILPPSHVNIRQLQEWKSSSTPASETSDQDFAFYAEKQNQNQNQESIGNNHYPSPHGSHHHPLSDSCRNGGAVAHLLLKPQIRILHFMQSSKSKIKRALGTIIIHLHTAPTTIHFHTAHMIPLGANLQLVASAKGKLLGDKMNSTHWCHIKHLMSWVVCWMPLNKQGNRCNRKPIHCY
uniref:Uncharacterized protein n=1 Tax=Populus davidiana TaxID=266767 RepID=A0A6M2EUT1_9ROSI